MGHWPCDEMSDQAAAQENCSCKHATCCLEQLFEACVIKHETQLPCIATDLFYLAGFGSSKISGANGPACHMGSLTHPLSLTTQGCNEQRLMKVQSEVDCTYLQWGAVDLACLICANSLHICSCRHPHLPHADPCNFIEWLRDLHAAIAF